MRRSVLTSGWFKRYVKSESRRCGSLVFSHCYWSRRQAGQLANYCHEGDARPDINAVSRRELAEGDNAGVRWRDFKMRWQSIFK